MSTDLFFSQPIPQNPSTGIQSDKIGPSGLDRSAKIRTTDDSPEGDGDNFLTTLKQVSHDRTPTNRSQHAGEAQSSETTASVVGGEVDETSDHAATQVDMTAQNEPDAEPDQMASDWNFMAFIKVLEDMGLYDAIGGSDLQKLSDVNPADGNQLAAIKTLIARLQQNHFVPTADLKVGFERLQQFIANALEGKVLLPIDGTPGQGLSPNPATELAQINRWLKGLTSEAQDQKGNPGLLMGEGKPSGAMPAKAGVGNETAVRSLEMNSSIRGSGAFQSAENSAVVSQSEKQGEADPAKLTSDTRPHDLANQQNTKATNAVENAATDASKIKEALGFLRDTRTTNRTEVPNRMPPAPDQDQQTSTENTRGSQPLKPSASSGLNPAVAKVSESQIQGTSGEEPLSKVFLESQLLKEGDVKVESGTTEETISKVIKTQAGTHDNGLLNSSGQNAEKAAETASSSKETESGQSSLRNQTLDQIVRKAAIHLRNGQHEARIDLKPEFLGHIRMQVISENQQVTVRILAEHGFVKDMIENNIHQLKADLQQQGLEVDKLDVSVSRDADGNKHSQENADRAKNRQHETDNTGGDNAREKNQKPQEPAALTADGLATVDYFA